MSFKPFAFREAFRRGYEAALWLDASMIAVRSLAPILAKTVRRGVYLWGNGATCGEWASDDILKRFGISRDESMRVEEVVSCVVGLSSRHAQGRQFLAQWLEMAADGHSFRGVPFPHPWSASRANTHGLVSTDPRVKGHRWDQTAASLIAYRQGLRISHLDCLDVIHYENGTGRYVEDLPLTVRLVQNRDFKGGQMGGVERWRRGGRERVGQFPRRLLKTLRRVVRTLMIRRMFGARGRREHG